MQAVGTVVVGVDVDVDDDVTRDVAVDIAATEEALHMAAVEVHGDVAGDVGGTGFGTLGTAKDGLVLAAVDIEDDVTREVGVARASVEGADVGAAHERHLAATATGFVTAAIGVGHHDGTAAVGLDLEARIIDVALGVGTTEHLGDETAVDLGPRGAADVGTRIALTGTVAAAEDLIDTASLDDDVVVFSVGCVAATIDRLDGVLLAVVHVHKSAAIVGIGAMGRLVATTIDGTEGEVFVVIGQRLDVLAGE